MMVVKVLLQGPNRALVGLYQGPTFESRNSKEYPRARRRRAIKNGIKFCAWQTRIVWVSELALLFSFIGSFEEGFRSWELASIKRHVSIKCGCLQAVFVTKKTCTVWRKKCTMVTAALFLWQAKLHWVLSFMLTEWLNILYFQLYR